VIYRGEKLCSCFWCCTTLWQCPISHRNILYYKHVHVCNNLYSHYSLFPTASCTKFELFDYRSRECTISCNVINSRNKPKYWESPPFVQQGKWVHSYSIFQDQYKLFWWSSHMLTWVNCIANDQSVMSITYYFTRWQETSNITMMAYQCYPTTHGYSEHAMILGRCSPQVEVTGFNHIDYWFNHMAVVDLERWFLWKREFLWKALQPPVCHCMVTGKVILPYQSYRHTTHYTEHTILQTTMAHNNKINIGR